MRTTKKNGPAPIPTEILKQRGSWRAKARAKTEPQIAAGHPSCPDVLKGFAKRTWNALCRDLEGLGILTPIDGKALARYCAGWAMWVEMQKDTSPDPEYKRLDKMLKLSESLLRFEMQYGLTPASRPNVHRVEKPKHGNAHPKETKQSYFAS